MRRNYWLSIPLAAVLAAPYLVGCGGSGSNVTGQRVPLRDTVQNFSVSVTTDKSAYHVGEPIQITVSVTNTDTNSHTLAYPTSNPVVRWGYIIGQGGNIVTYEYWPGHNLYFDASIGKDNYGPGETKAFSYVFPYEPTGAVSPPVTSLAPGTYQIYARQGDVTYDDTVKVTHIVPTPASNPVSIIVTP